MIDTLWQILLGSLLAAGIVFLWIVIVALIIAAIKQLRKAGH